ncbi:hypothetical protein QVD17_41675 [Tagetes erecta]|uniref:Uncharacterized protein n=1 Tax=Tagetes erecta TaxID=13708 RepID=A0AAD8NFS2_TARER|nr:hypothetical protein QVD17_41675 [Tagetes erecta]
MYQYHMRHGGKKDVCLAPEKSKTLATGWGSKQEAKQKPDSIELEITVEVKDDEQLEKFTQSVEATTFEKVEIAQSEEVALMAQSEQPKVDSSSSDSNKPSNHVPLPERVREKLCLVECLEQIEHY